MKVGTTVQNNGRGEDACPELIAEATSVLDTARFLCSDLSAALELEIDRLKHDTKPDGNRKRHFDEIDKLVREARGVLENVVGVRTKLLRAMDSHSLKTGLMDLEQARKEIARKLARLAA